MTITWTVWKRNELWCTACNKNVFISTHILREKTIPQILNCYPEIIAKNDSGKEVIEFGNKYWVMVKDACCDQLYPKKDSRKLVYNLYYVFKFKDWIAYWSCLLFLSERKSNGVNGQMIGLCTLFLLMSTARQGRHWLHSTT